MITIFDVDGVLIDVSKSYHYSIKDTVDYFSKKDNNLKDLLDIKLTFGINNDWDASLSGILYSLSGLDLKTFKEIFKPYSTRLEDFYRFAKDYNIKLPDYKELVEYFEDRYKTHRDKEQLIIPHHILSKVREKSDIMGVITGRPYPDLDYTFKMFDLYKYFDLIITEDDIPQPNLRKPSSYPLRLFFKKFNYKNPTFYIGDTIADYLMVYNYNKEEGKNVEFILFENTYNQNLPSKIKVNNPDKLIEVLK
ncbi:HAD hydrolase-like protein [Sulfurihydrogenibium sp.]|uniref:HAD family hydrolase n=1 Tax=Sulfurihydrogenibium sp. TaxID=2053621 RepID=UPI002622C39B|nr:HAD hydrolase-like protein [Sulfurihydrogenibium sp.]